MARRKLRSAASRRSRRSRNKGASGEREFAALLSAAIGVEITRNLGASRDGGDDVVLDNLSFEVKRCQAINVERWLNQAEENCREGRSKGRTPIVVFRKNNGAWRTCMNLPDFFVLLKNARANEIKSA